MLGEFRKGFCRWFTNNLIMILLFVGVSLLVGGALFEMHKAMNVDSGVGYIDAFLSQLSTILMKIGGAIIGGGVFAALMKSAQFTKAFQKQVFEVFNHPHRVVKRANLESAWMELTISRMKGVLPKSYLKAAKILNDQFFKKDMDYHFEEYVSTYNIQIPKGGTKALVDHTTTMKIVKSPRAKKIILTQKMKLEEGEEEPNITVKKLKIGLNDIADKIQYEEVGDSREFNFEMNLRDYFDFNNVEDDYRLAFERQTELVQDIVEDPIFAAQTDRYVKGSFKVRVKVSEGYKVYFHIDAGKINPNCVDVDSEGYDRWELIEEPGGILLPGNGFVFVIVACQE